MTGVYLTPEQVVVVRAYGQARLARHLGTHQSIVNYWVNGRRPVAPAWWGELAPLGIVLRDPDAAPEPVRKCRWCTNAKRRGICRRHAHPEDRRFHVKTRAQWSAAEVERLRALAGTLPARGIAVRLTEEFGIQRTRDGVTGQAKVLGISLDCAAPWSCNMLAALFRAHKYTVRAWVAAGFLHAERLPVEMGARGTVPQWVFHEPEIRRFLQAYPWLYDAQRMRPASHPLARYAVLIQQRHPWITATQAASQLGRHPSTVHECIAAGLIPHRVRQGGTYMLPVDQLPTIKATLEVRASTAQRLRWAALARVNTEKAARRLAA